MLGYSAVAVLFCSNMMVWQAVIFGPDDTPWEGGTFNVMLEFSEDYPNKPPKVDNQIYDYSIPDSTTIAHNTTHTSRDVRAMLLMHTPFS